MAEKVNYDNGFGGQEVVTDLVILGDNWWLERGEYDGSEWWGFRTVPKVSTDSKLITTLGDDNSWVSMDDVHNPEVC